MLDEPPVSDLLSVAQAIEILDSVAVQPRAIRVPLDRAQGLHLAQDLTADRDYPPFDKSQMDGYALRAADVQAERATTLRCVGEIAAGSDSRPQIQAGETVAIMTGAPLPPGADAVIPVENRAGTTRDDRGEFVELLGPARPGRYIATRGSDCAAGEVVLNRGQKLGPAQLAVAATIGAAELHVYARPRVGVLTTGDEIVPFHRDPQPHQIRNSNSPMLLALLCALGCDAADLGIARDDPAVIRDAVARALEEHDVLMITGGMSMGEHDYVPRVLRELGVELRITKLRIKPGKPFVFGTKDEHRFIFGLPGNPVSGFACTLRLCSRLLARLAGASAITDRFIAARLEHDLGANGPREFYQPALLSFRNDRPTVRALDWKSSGDVFTLGRANCLLVRPENDPARPAGSIVNTLEIARRQET